MTPAWCADCDGWAAPGGRASCACPCCGYERHLCKAHAGEAGLCRACLAFLHTSVLPTLQEFALRFPDGGGTTAP